MKILTLFLAFLTPALLSAAYPPMTVKTLDGQVFENAVIENVGPDGIDIGYVNENGHYALKGISFKKLPEDLRKKFGYDAKAAEAFEARLKAYSAKDMQTIATDEKNRLERVMAQVKQKLAGESVKIKPEDLRFAIYAKRSSVEVREAEATKTGCVVKVEKNVSGTKIDDEFIQLDSQNLPDDGPWSGFLYPTGLKTRYKGKDIPVFTDDLDRASKLVNEYLDMYSEYAASNPNGTTAADTAAAIPPDQSATAATTQPTQTQTQQQPQQTTTTTYPDDAYDAPYYYYGGGGGYYYIGPYYPVYWWNNHRPPHPRPHPRPRPDGDRPGQRPDQRPDQRPGRRPEATGQRQETPVQRPEGFGQRAPQPRGETIQTPTHTIERSGNFRRATPRTMSPGATVRPGSHTPIGRF